MLGAVSQILRLLLLRSEVVLHMHLHVLAVLLLLAGQLLQSLHLLPLLLPLGQQFTGSGHVALRGQGSGGLLQLRLLLRQALLVFV